MAIPSSYDEVKSHLQQILNDPSTPLDTTLLDKLKLELTETTDRRVPGALLTQISQLLPVLQEDLTPITTLGIKAASFFSFSDIRAVDPPIDFIAGFKAPSPPVNLLALSLLSKAGRNSSDAAIVAGNSELVASLVELWLSTTSTAVAQAALDVLWALLEIDLPNPSEDETNDRGIEQAFSGQGLVWKRIFTDKDVYGSLFSLCSLADGEAGGLPKRERTVAQGRLMGFLVMVGNLRWDIISSSQIPEIETKYNSHSILDYAACHMVDQKDVLMHMTLLNFLRDLLEIGAPGLRARAYIHATSAFSSPALDFLIAHGLHSRVLECYLDEAKLDPVDLRYLYGPIMTYVAQYAELYPNHLLQNPSSLLDKIVSRVSASLAISPSQWAHVPVPSGQLDVLASLPRVLLVEASKHGLNPVLSIPTNPPCKEALDALAKILHGPMQSDDITDSMELNTSDQQPTNWRREAAAARILYFMYLNEHANFWTDIVTAADLLTMKDVSLAAISFMKTIITANWHVLSGEVTSSAPDTSRYQLPLEEALGTLSPAAQGVLPTSGVWAALTPPALTALLPYLFKPPRSYAEFVGGGAGDTQNVVWKVATAKYEVLVALYNRLKNTGDQVAGFEDIIRTLKQRVSEGPWGPATQTVARVETVGL